MCCFFSSHFVCVYTANKELRNDHTYYNVVHYTHFFFLESTYHFLVSSLPHVSLLVTISLTYSFHASDNCWHRTLQFWRFFVVVVVVISRHPTLSLS